MIEAIITGIVAIAVCMINNAWQNKRADKQHQATMAATEKQHDTTIRLVEYKLDQLTKKVEKHNGLVERLYAVEKQLGIEEERINVANHRIDDLEQFHK